jgi:hypothetical protein
MPELPTLVRLRHSLTFSRSFREAATERAAKAEDEQPSSCGEVSPGVLNQFTHCKSRTMKFSSLLIALVALIGAEAFSPRRFTFICVVVP